MCVWIRYHSSPSIILADPPISFHTHENNKRNTTNYGANHIIHGTRSSNTTLPLYYLLSVNERGSKPKNVGKKRGKVPSIRTVVFFFVPVDDFFFAVTDSYYYYYYRFGCFREGLKGKANIYQIYSGSLGMCDSFLMMMLLLVWVCQHFRQK